MIFDTKRKAETQASAHLTTNTYYIMIYTKRKRLRLHVATIEDFLTILRVARDSFVIVVRICQINHRA